MKTIIIAFAALCFAVLPALPQQSIDNVLAAIEANNTTLKALQQETEAEKAGHKTDIYLSGPEVGFNYLYGNPNEIGKRTDFSISQSFDLATITGSKSRVANAQNKLADIKYRSERTQILLEAKQLCLDLIYCNALEKEYAIRNQHAATIVKLYEARLKKGDVNRIEYNKAMLNLVTVQGEAAQVETERKAVRAELKRLNGGTEVELTDTQFAPVNIPDDFRQWYQQAEQAHPAIAALRQEIEVGQKQVSLTKAMALPSISAGYMSEKVVGEQYRGVSVGVSIPLWENKNRVKQAKATLRAAQMREADGRLQLYNQLEALFNIARLMSTTADNYRKALGTINNTNLLEKALDAGEISLLEYILEIELYYDTVTQALDAERDAQKALAQLSAYSL